MISPRAGLSGEISKIIPKQQEQTASASES
jgi:hypothetical protein